MCGEEGGAVGEGGAMEQRGIAKDTDYTLQAVHACYQLVLQLGMSVPSYPICLPSLHPLLTPGCGEGAVPLE